MVKTGTVKTRPENWWLLAVCAGLFAVISFIDFGQFRSGFHSMRDVFLAGRLTMTAGVCTVAAALWGARRAKSWLLALSGLALIALGTLLSGVLGPRIGLRAIALLILVMALALGLTQLEAARAMWRLHHVASGWLVAAAGIVLIGLALPLVAWGFRWVAVAPGASPEILWMSLYFGFSAICMLALALNGGSSRQDLMTTIQ